MLILCTNACTYWHKGNRKILCLGTRLSYLGSQHVPQVFSIYSPVFVHTFSLLDFVHLVDRLRGTTWSSLWFCENGQQLIHIPKCLPAHCWYFKSSKELSDFLFCFFLIFFCDFFRWFWRDLTGVDACAANVRGRGANALHPWGSQFRPSDGHGDRSLWVAHGQRQPAHLAIDKPGRHPKYGLTSSKRDWEFWRVFGRQSGTEQEYWENMQLLCDGYLTLLAPWGTKKQTLTLTDGGKLLVFSSFWGPGFTQTHDGASIFYRHSFLCSHRPQMMLPASPVKCATATDFFYPHLGNNVCSKLFKNKVSEVCM